MNKILSGKIVSFKVKDNNEVRQDKQIDIPISCEPKVLKERESKLSGVTYKIKPPGSSSMYITINDDKGEPFEIFINSKDVTHFQWTAALTRVISAVMRKESKDDIRFLVDELKSVVDPNGGYWANGKYVKSMVSEIGSVLEQHLADKDKPEIVYPPNAVPCHVCGEKALIKNDGCEECVACGYSKCS